MKGRKFRLFQLGESARNFAVCQDTSLRSILTLASIGFGPPNMDDPAMRVSPPASTIRRIFVSLIPPSISRRHDGLRSSSSARARTILSSIAGMNVCPPKPGLTVISNKLPMNGTISAIVVSGVPGHRAIPAVAPSS
jgi:hypothetical protein